MIQYVEGIEKRIDLLYRRGACAASVSEKSDLLPLAFKELGTSAEEMMVAIEHLSTQQEQLARAQQQIEIERQRYKNLFTEAPDAYLVTDSAGTIHELNAAAAQLFNCSRDLLLGKPLTILVPKEERRDFRERFHQQREQAVRREWNLRLHSPYREPFDVMMIVTPELDRFKNVLFIRLCLQKTVRPSTKAGEGGISTDDLIGDRPRQAFVKGDSIPLHCDGIWIVARGWVKLCTLTEKNEEILMGLVGARSPFGASLTSLPIYQATALSPTVELVKISSDEIAICPKLSAYLYEQIVQRLHQTELLLAVCGRRRVIDRLVYLLSVLKGIAGEPVPEGTRLSLRMTHQELADTCCTTRVTITRLLGELQQQGKIAIDSESHIILRA